MRRVRRILPALVFLLIGTAVLSSIILVPSDLILFAKSSVASITAWSNVFFSNISGGYWGKDVSIMPLAHLWSLAVEEQFYFLWPAVFFCLYVFVPAKHLRRILIGVFVLLFVGSAVIAKHPKAYYMLTARAFELMIGVLLAIEKENVTQIVHRVPSIVASGCGGALILLSALVLKEGVSFPGWNALWPCLGAGLLIVPPKGSNIFVRCLESAPMVYIGKISYSLYLWHWPFFALLLAAIPLDIVTQRQKVVDSVIDSVAAKYPTVKVLDPKALICRDGNCFAALDDMPLYADDDHLNYYGSRYLAKKYLSKNINPFSID